MADAHAAAVWNQGDKIESAADQAIRGSGKASLVADYLNESARNGNIADVAGNIAWRGVRMGAWNEAEVKNNAAGQPSELLFYGGGREVLHCSTGQASTWSCDTGAAQQHHEAARRVRR